MNRLLPSLLSALCSLLCSTAQAQTVYNPLPSTSGLIAHWKLDETSGTSAADSSGNSNTGTLTNSPIWTNGIIAGALNFNGTNQTVRIPNSASLTALNTFTVCCWVNPTQTNLTSGVVSKRNGTGGYNEWIIQLNSIGQVTFGVYGDPPPLHLTHFKE